MEFRNTGQTDTELKNKIQDLFNQAKSQWTGVFPIVQKKLFVRFVLYFSDALLRNSPWKPLAVSDQLLAF